MYASPSLSLAASISASSFLVASDASLALACRARSSTCGDKRMDGDRAHAHHARPLHSQTDAGMCVMASNQLDLLLHKAKALNLELQSLQMCLVLLLLLDGRRQPGLSMR